MYPLQQTPQKSSSVTKPEQRKRIEVSLPRPFPLQADIIYSPAKRKVVCAGRRAGKTHAAGQMAITRLLNGKRVLLSSTSQDQADVFWRYVKQWTRPLAAAGLLYKNETRRIITMREGEIRVKTGSDADALRGDNVNLLVLDECARLDPSAWYEVGAPMLADSYGDAVFISTPARRNWFFDLYNRALADGTGTWAAWHFATTANPFLAQPALDLLMADMSEEAYRQEILAEFLESSGAVFRHVDERCTAARREPYPGRFVAGVDFAQSHDYTVIVVMDADARTVVDYDRFNQQDWSLQRGRLRAMSDRWGCEKIVAEKNSAGGPNIEAMQREGLPVVAFETTASSKSPLIESLVLAFDRAEITALDDAVFKSELMSYERKVSAVTGRSQYSAPEGGHDDCVMALALAWHGIASGRFTLETISLSW